MERIELKQIKKKEGCVCYNFDCSESLNKYFTEIDFCITYPESIEIVPDGVLAIPFVTNTLQIAWLADCELIIPELDRDFYESIPKFLEGFKKMYPEATFAGKLTVGKITDCKPQSSGESATLFSGGLDATTTLLRHIDENPHLISIWGSDVDYDNVSELASYITPVPGGVGPMTVYELMHNVYTAHYLRSKYVKNKK